MGAVEQSPINVNSMNNCGQCHQHCDLDQGPSHYGNFLKYNDSLENHILHEIHLIVLQMTGLELVALGCFSMTHKQLHIAEHLKNLKPAGKNQMLKDYKDNADTFINHFMKGL